MCSRWPPRPPLSASRGQDRALARPSQLAAPRTARVRRPRPVARPRLHHIPRLRIRQRPLPARTPTRRHVARRVRRPQIPIAIIRVIQMPVVPRLDQLTAPAARHHAPLHRQPYFLPELLMPAAIPHGLPRRPQPRTLTLTTNRGAKPMRTRPRHEPTTAHLTDSLTHSRHLRFSPETHGEGNGRARGGAARSR
jgi:hypothetical protein